MVIYTICIWAKGKRRYIKIQAYTPFEALKKFKANMDELAYGAIQIDKIV